MVCLIDFAWGRRLGWITAIQIVSFPAPLLIIGQRAGHKKMCFLQMTEVGNKCALRPRFVSFSPRLHEDDACSSFGSPGPTLWSLRPKRERKKAQVRATPWAAPRADQ